MRIYPVVVFIRVQENLKRGYFIIFCGKYFVNNKLSHSKFQKHFIFHHEPVKQFTTIYSLNSP